MRNLLLFIGLLGFHESWGQVVKDLDKDGIKDTISFNPKNGEIICRLSTKGFRPIVGKAEPNDEVNTGVRETKSGFDFFVDYMRAGYANQFRYEEKDKKIRMIGMSRYEFGPASNDGSGESSVNLLTNNYIGEWHAFDFEKGKLTKMKVLETKMYFPKIYLEKYNRAYQSSYEEKCNALYQKERVKYK